jgi:peptidoglycan/xylan/chitin deacetylase (PgdA/CDA1 family)
MTTTALIALLLAASGQRVGVNPNADVSHARVTSTGGTTARSLADHLATLPDAKITAGSETKSLAEWAADIERVNASAAHVPFQTSGCYTSGSALGTEGEVLTITRAASASYDNGSTLATCPADQLRVSSRGALIEPPRTNRLTWTNDLSNAAWVKRGTATTTRDGSFGPDGTTQTTLLSNVGQAGLNDVYQTVNSGFGASAAIPTTFWIKKVSASGTLWARNPQGIGKGLHKIDLALLPSGWQRIGDAPVPGVSLNVPLTGYPDNRWVSTAAGAGGVQFDTGGAGEAGPAVSFYISAVQQEEGPYPTSFVAGTRAAGDSVSVVNPLATGDLNWCIEAGLWTLGAGANSASLVRGGANLVFSVTDGAGATKTVTAPAAEFMPTQHRIAACNAAGRLALYVDGLQYGTVGGNGTGVMTSQPTSLSVSEAYGPLPAIRVAKSANPAALDQAPSPGLVVAFTFDDGTQDHADYAAPILESHGMRGTFYVQADKQGRTDPATMTWDTLRSMEDRGHEIGSHTLTHVQLLTSQWPTDFLARQICDSRARMISQGFNVRSLAYPWGAYDATTEALVASCGYTSARIVAGLNNSRGACGSAASMTGSPYFDTIPPRDGWTRLRTPYANGDNLCTVDDLKNTVLDAEAHLPAANGRPGVLAFMLHRVCPQKTCATSYAIDTGDFSAFLDWLQQRSASGTVVKTIGDAMGVAAPPAVWSGTPNIVNGDMETYVNSGTALPDCWTQDATGASATWAKITGRSGSGFAQQATVTSWSSGPVRLTEDVAQYRACNMPTTPGRNYRITCWYKSDVPVRFDARYAKASDASLVTTPFAQSATFAASPAAWAQASWTAAAPADASTVAFGLGVFDGVCSSGCIGANGTATLQIDDCSAVEAP